MVERWFVERSYKAVIIQGRVWDKYISDPFSTIARKQNSDPSLGNTPGLLVIDMYNLVFEGGDGRVEDLIAKFPSSCGQVAFRSVPFINTLIAEFRKRDFPIWFSTKAWEQSKVHGHATRKPRKLPKLIDYELFNELDYQSSDNLIRKLRASVFFETNLPEQLLEGGVDSLVIVGESTSGCVRASVVDGFSLGYPVTVVEDCVFDQNPVSHAVNLFDMHHKYAAVCSLDQTISALKNSE